MSIHTTIQINLIREGDVSIYHQDLVEAEPKFTVARIGWPEDHIAIMLPYGSRLVFQSPREASLTGANPRH